MQLGRHWKIRFNYKISCVHWSKIRASHANQQLQWSESWCSTEIHLRTEEGVYQMFNSSIPINTHPEMCSFNTRIVSKLILFSIINDQNKYKEGTIKPSNDNVKKFPPKCHIKTVDMLVACPWANATHYSNNRCHLFNFSLSCCPFDAKNTTKSVKTTCGGKQHVLLSYSNK